MISHSLYIFAFLVFAIFLFVSLFLHTDFKFYVMNFFEQMMKNIETDIELEEKEIEELEKEIEQLKEDLKK